MARMTRTQISLEDEQYRFLKREAARRELSLSSVLREFDRRADARSGGRRHQYHVDEGRLQRRTAYRAWSMTSSCTKP